MSTFTNKSRSLPKPFVLRDFGGLDPGGGEGAFTELRNFRVIGGSLVKRSGSRVYAEYPSDIRGLWYGDFDGEDVLFCVAGDRVYRGVGDGRTTIGSLSTSSGRAALFYRGGVLYILDGADILAYDGTTLRSVEGYVPTVRVSSDDTVGTPFYDRNRLTDRVRVIFNGAKINKAYPLWGNVAAVESATLNGAAASYSVSGSGTSTTVSLVTGYGQLVVTYRLVDEGYRSDLVRHLCSLVYSSLGDNTVFLYGGPTKSRVIYSGQVEGVATVDYFPLSNKIDAGTGDRPVTALLRQYDSVMLFTSGETYMMNPKSEENSLGYSCVRYPLYTLNPNIGCSGMQNARQADENPVSVARDGVYRWVETNKQGERTAKLISGRVASLLDGALLDGCITHVCRRHNEFWLSYGGAVMVYSIDDGIWYSFDGIGAESFIETEDTCYASGRFLYIFDESLSSDNGVAFTAAAQTGYIDFGVPHLTKRLYRTQLAFGVVDSTFDNAATLKLYGDASAEYMEYDIAPSHASPQTMRFSTLLPRFTFMRLRLTDTSSAPLTLTSVTLAYRVLGEGD